MVRRGKLFKIGLLWMRDGVLGFVGRDIPCWATSSTRYLAERGKLGDNPKLIAALQRRCA